jgi:hypothetical protein
VRSGDRGGKRGKGKASRRAEQADRGKCHGASLLVWTGITLPAGFHKNGIS